MLFWLFILWNETVGYANVHTYVFLSSKLLMPQEYFFANDVGIIKIIAVFEGEKLQTNNSPG